MMLEETGEHKKEKPVVHKKCGKCVNEDNLIAISENRENVRKDRASDRCEQSKAATVCVIHEEELVLRSSPLPAHGGKNGLGSCCFRHETNYTPYAFVLFWHRLLGAPM